MSALRSILERVGQTSEVCFRIRFADGAESRSRDGAPAFTLIFRTSAAERRVITQRHIGLLEGYFDGDVDIEGSLQMAMRAG
ncbi:MAG TPA: hypothetical protein VLW45_05375, partial [Pelomicrobium sp.]|nr:hypothetical protein [Pelomicrobium sp.]